MLEDLNGRVTGKASGVSLKKGKVSVLTCDQQAFSESKVIGNLCGYTSYNSDCATIVLIK